MASIAQAKLAMKEIHQTRLTAIEKNPTIINIVETNFSKFSLSLIIKSLDLLFSGILVSEVATIWKSIFVLENLTKLHNNPSKINSNWMELTVNRRVIASSKGSKKISPL